jgi:probable addiction module antidote protein
MPVPTRLLDVAELLPTPEHQAEFLALALAEGDLEEIKHALGVIARTRGMTEVAREAGLGRESLYKALGENGNPEFGTILKLIAALGLQLSVTPRPAA